MSLSAAEITIAITVYNRRDYLKQSIRSALGQTTPVRVMVVEDCGPDSLLREHVLGEFGSAVTYFRSPRRRGIFGNWNTCIEQCRTRWLSILHDDDYLMPEFVEAMIELNNLAGERGLYFGRTTVTDSHGNPRPEWERPALQAPWLPITLADVLLKPPFSFPGQLFQTPLARSLGGFRETSLWTGEWELWTKLIAYHEGAQTGRRVAVFRDHTGSERGTSLMYRSGKPHALAAVQCKRNLSLARRLGVEAISVNQWRRSRPAIPLGYLLQYAKYFSPMYLAYNTRRFHSAPSANLRHALCQAAVRVGGLSMVRRASHFWNLLRKPT